MIKIAKFNKKGRKTKKYRTIEGKKYNSYGFRGKKTNQWYNELRKNDAQEVAQKKRKQGHSARVLPRSKGFYAVYYRKKGT